VFAPSHRETNALDRHDIAIIYHQIVNFNVVLCSVLCHTLLGFPWLCDYLPG
jgi:hypothetical protein